MAIAVATIFLIGRALVHNFFSELESQLARFSTYAQIHAWWPFLPASLSLGVATVKMSSVGGRRLIPVMAAALFLMVEQRLWVLATVDHSLFNGRPDEDGVCIQSTDFTCGPAAASTLLTHIGFQTDEKEMAILSGASPLTGTDLFSLCRGLNEKVFDEGYRVSLVRSNWAALREMKIPALASLRDRALVDHWVVVFGADEHGVTVGDPFEGKYVMPKEYFLERWREKLVTVH